MDTVCMCNMCVRFSYDMHCHITDELQRTIQAEAVRYGKLEKETSMEMSSRLALANEKLQQRDRKVAELSLRLHMLSEAALNDQRSSAIF